MFMGMGEPLNNYDAVVDAIRCMSQSENQMGFNIPCPKICVSTVGVIPNIYRFSEDCPTVSMALSLRANAGDSEENCPHGDGVSFGRADAMFGRLFSEK